MRKEERLVVRPSFAMPFGGGKIFFVQLDGLGTRRELAMQKFREDMETLRKPSAPSLIGLHVKDTAMDPAMMRSMIDAMNAPGQHIKKVAAVGLGWNNRLRWKRLARACEPPVRYGLAFFEDYEKAKLWLVR